jgi:hypothetical protein
MAVSKASEQALRAGMDRLLRGKAIRVSRAPDDEVGSRVVKAGLAKFHEGGWWANPEHEPTMEKVIVGVLQGQVVAYAIESLRPTLALVPKAHRERAIQHESQEEVKSPRDRAVSANAGSTLDGLQRNLEAQDQRRGMCLPVAVAAARRAAGGEPIWLGDPRTLLDPEMEPNLKLAAGSEKTAMGAAVWIGHDPRLFAVLCPTAGRIKYRIAVKWVQEGVQVYVGACSESYRIARALGWDQDEIHLVDKRNALRLVWPTDTSPTDGISRPARRYA